ncbi:hypothetical protein H2200_003752 [Cladophialophora chaetospira]|uniref:N-acetyltransferase domain-containing protein n=1 Tax=Cladophialophora chaetospira TaxID=386627 RepID=A0AA39CL08_9EURO|nr:hypothetical protein H2200_003752 [Cladophialophora chaetospira]
MLKAHPELVTFVAFPIINTEEDFMEEVYKSISSSSADCLYAVIDKVAASGEGSTSGKFAGVISLTSTDPSNAVTEIGVMISPAFQRTHVATNAIGLFLLWILDPPSAGGLGLRRVVWQTHADNAGSRRTALRMGFEFEGVARWQRTFPGGRIALSAEALRVRNGTKEEQPGRHTAVFSIVWDEWEEKRPKVLAQMERKH